MKNSHFVVSYLFVFFIITAIVDDAVGGEYSQYPTYEAKSYDHHHHDYHAPKKSAHVDINIPVDFGTLAKLGILGLTQLKLLLALGKVAGAGLGVSALGLGSLGKLALSVAPVHKGIAIDLQPHAKHHHYEHHEKHY